MIFILFRHPKAERRYIESKNFSPDHLTKSVFMYWFTNFSSKWFKWFRKTLEQCEGDFVENESSC